MKIPRDRPLSERPGLWACVLIAAVAAATAWVFRSPVRVAHDALWREAEADFLAGRHDRAEAALARLERLRAPTPLDRILRAQVGMVRNRPEDVLAQLDLVPDAHAMAPQARLLAGQYELRRHRMSRAENYLKRAVQLDPTLVQAHKELVYVYGMLLRRHELNRAFLALSKVSSLTFENVFHWCLTRNSVWDAAEITDDLQSYIEADPNDRWSRLALAENLRQRGRPGEAETMLGPLPQDDPDALVVRTRIALDRNDEEAAEALLRRGPENHPELARLRGRVALARGDTLSALRAFQAAHQVEPDDRDTLAGLGQALAKSGDLQAAAPYLAAARDHDALGTLLQRAATEGGRSDPALWRALGAACETIHRLPEAKAWYELVIRANPLDTDAQKALFRLNVALKQADDRHSPSGDGGSTTVRVAEDPANR